MSDFALEGHSAIDLNLALEPFQILLRYGVEEALAGTCLGESILTLVNTSTKERQQLKRQLLGLAMAMACNQLHIKQSLQSTL